MVPTQSDLPDLLGRLTALPVRRRPGRGHVAVLAPAGKDLPAKRLGKPGDRKLIVNLTFSPDGRYVLYSDNGPGWLRGTR